MVGAAAPSSSLAVYKTKGLLFASSSRRRSPLAPSSTAPAIRQTETPWPSRLAPLPRMRQRGRDHFARKCHIALNQRLPGGTFPLDLLDVGRSLSSGSLPSIRERRCRSCLETQYLASPRRV